MPVLETPLYVLDRCLLKVSLCEDELGTSAPVAKKPSRARTYVVGGVLRNVPYAQRWVLVHRAFLRLSLALQAHSANGS